jgi:hypothetical protein
MLIEVVGERLLISREIEINGATIRLPNEVESVSSLED